MVKVGKWIAKHRILMLIIGFLLIIPSVIGMAATKVNYDLLSYLPEHLETVKGQDILVDEYGMGAFSMVVVENMEMKDVQKLEEKFEQVNHVKEVLWYDDVADISVPVEMIPEKLRKAFYNGDATMMLVLFDNTTSSDDSMEAIEDLRKIANEQCFIGGMTGVVTDIKNVALKELPVYVVIAAVLSLVVIELTSTSFVVPILFLLSIGLAILYNLGSNVFLGETSYITKALTAVLQLGVTMDYSIFLLNSFEENKKRFPDDKERAMGHAIANTFKSVAGSSVTTVAGFLALCVMTFALGRDLGIVMAKGVLIGVVCCVTVLPAMVLVFDKAIEKTRHKPLVKSLDKPSAFITKHYKVWVVIFLVLLFPSIYGNNHTQIYYNIARSLPSTLDCNVANDEVKAQFDVSNMHIVMMDRDMDSKQKKKMMEEIGNVKGVKSTFALGRDLGIVMAKGVLIGVVCCVTVLPAMVLVFDKAIEKTRHKPLVKSLDKPSAFITKHYKVWVVIFLVLLFPSIYGNNHTQIYYNIARSLPSTLDCNVANDEVKAQFDVSNMHIVMMDRDMDSKQKKKMMEEIGNVKGVKSTISMSSLLGPTIPESMIPENLRSMLQSDEYELAFVSSEYESATDEVNEQVKAIDKIVKSYDKNGMVIGEAPLMKDLQDVTDADLVNVNVLSIGAIFIIILLIFKSISLPIILVAVIEFAIMLNMAIPYYQGTSLPFVASIVIGAIQLGATVDYAILMTTRYQKERQNGKDKKEAISIAHKTSMPSIISSGLSFFAATFGVACYSQVEMIGSICTLLARGAIISMVVVILILPAMFMIFDKLICKTSIGFLKKKTK